VAHGLDVEGGIVEEREMDLPAHRGNVGLLKNQLGRLKPPRATVARGGHCDHVGAGICDGAQDAAVLGRERLDELLAEVGGGKDMRG
jgi:hypothetical protein